MGSRRNNESACGHLVGGGERASHAPCFNAEPVPMPARKAFASLAGRASQALSYGTVRIVTTPVSDGGVALHTWHLHHF